MITLTSRPLTLLANLLHCLCTRRLGRAAMHAPLGELDEWLVGKPWDFFQRGVREPHSDDGPFWAARSTLCELRHGHPECVTPPPITVVTGLHDFFAEQALVDYTRAARLHLGRALLLHC